MRITPACCHTCACLNSVTEQTCTGSNTSSTEHVTVVTSCNLPSNFFHLFFFSFLVCLLVSFFLSSLQCLLPSCVFFFTFYSSFSFYSFSLSSPLLLFLYLLSLTLSFLVLLGSFLSFFLSSCLSFPDYSDLHFSSLSFFLCLNPLIVFFPSSPLFLSFFHSSFYGTLIRSFFLCLPSFRFRP
jgi:hypothetical protein